MSGPPAYPPGLGDALLEILLAAAQSQVQPPPHAVKAIVAQTLSRYLGPHQELVEHRRLAGIVLRRLRQGLYLLGMAGIGATLTAMFAGALHPASIVAALSSSMVSLLVGVLIELLERPR